MVQKICINKSGVTQFPAYLQHAHDLCFLNHDVLVELLRSGEESKVFFHRIPLIDDNDRELLKEADDIFSWLETTNRVKERTELLKRIVFPALLSDFLHFTYEALECSRKGKLTVSYALIRKPLQENLFLFEVIASAKYDFAMWLVENPLKLRARHAGGLDAHIKRIGTVLSLLEQKDKFDAEYVAQLRYSKVEDGFDGVCNRAVHLFTQHEAIKTSPLNINLIFSGPEEKLTQWYYLYSRLPYLLSYARHLIEHICSTIVLTEPNYLRNIERRVSAGTLIWADQIDQNYKNEQIDKFVTHTRNHLFEECARAGCPKPTSHDLGVIYRSGELPS